MPDFRTPAEPTTKTYRRPGTTQITAACLFLASGLLVFGISSLPDGSAVAGADRGETAKSVSIPTEGLDPAHAAINEALQLLKSEVVLFDLPVEPGVSFDVAAVLEAVNDGQPITLEFWPHSVRAPGFRVMAQIDGGAMVEVDPGPERTLRGRIVEVEGSEMAGSLFETGLKAMILMPDGRELWIEPLAAHLPAGTFEPGLHVVYDREDAVGDPGVCGTTNQFVEQDDAQGQGEGGVASGIVCVKIAIDADLQYYQQHGSSVNTVTNAVSNIVNTANNQYENEVGIQHVITEIVIRTSAAENPYTTSDPAQLLSQFRGVWNSQPEWSIDRNVAHLFTGRNLSGNVLGIAYLNSMCQKSWAYGISQNLSAALFWKTDLFAHEVGHNWNATHCTCNTTTMNPSITGANSFIGPGSNSVNQIVNKKNSVSCPTSCSTGPPPNNTCATSLLAHEGTTPFTNIDATTDGPSDTLCNFSGNSQIQSDVWFRHTAQCTGTLHVRLCGTSPSFDTKLAVYSALCPTSSNTALACNKDGCGQLSSLNLPVVAGQTYRIRIGGHNNAQGSGVMTISCFPDIDPCPADLTGSGAVGVPDLLELLAAWGPCSDPGDCPADLTGSGSVGVPDLLELLAAWGPCP